MADKAANRSQLQTVWGEAHEESRFALRNHIEHHSMTELLDFAKREAFRGL